MTAGNVWALAGWIGVSLAAGAIGSLVTDPDSAWFRALDKPSWNPPDAVFAPVWTALYVLMGVAAWRAWRVRRAPAAVRLFLWHLVLNAAWSLIFFGARNIVLALATIVVLWVVIVILVSRFWRVDRMAGGLLLPYLAWVTFATALNAELLRRNW
jgi:benzodiazapine receptor